MLHRSNEEDSLLELNKQLSRTSYELESLHYNMRLAIEESEESLRALNAKDKLFETFDSCQQKLIDVSREYDSIRQMLEYYKETFPQ